MAALQSSNSVNRLKKRGQLQAFNFPDLGCWKFSPESGMVLLCPKMKKTLGFNSGSKPTVGQVLGLLSRRHLCSLIRAYGAALNHKTKSPQRSENL